MKEAEVMEEGQEIRKLGLKSQQFLRKHRKKAELITRCCCNKKKSLLSCQLSQNTVIFSESFVKSAVSTEAVLFLLVPSFLRALVCSV